MMKRCKCGSYAINPHFFGRDDTDLDLCDVCYWRKRAEKHQQGNSMKLQREIVVPAGAEFQEAPRVSKRAGEWVSHIIAIGKDHYAELIMDKDAFDELNSGEWKKGK